MTELTGLCREHSFERSEDICNRCGAEYCELCLVYPFGPRKSLCKECAMVAGGVRAHTVRPEMPKRDVKRRKKAFQARATGRAKARSETELATETFEPVLSDPLAPTPEDLERVPAMVPEDDGESVARDLADASSQPPQSLPSSAPVPAPADGVAPPIDWSQPFG